MNLKVYFAIVGTFIGCCTNVIFLELLVKIDPGSGNLITFLQFAFIAAEGFLFTSKCGRVTLRIGIGDYALLVIMFFIVSVCNNYAFDLNIPMPLHMIFRSGNLITNMIMATIILRKRYTPSKYVSVAMITIGIVVCTILSGSDVDRTVVHSSEIEPSTYSVHFWWTLGIMLLTTALLISAGMGIYQEQLYERYGKHPREALYVTHLLPLPGFLLLHQNIWQHLVIVSNTEPIQLVSIDVPIAWIYLIANCLSQYLCIGSVYVLTTECSALTVSLVLTLRKFVSLLFSIVYFQNPFTIYHWIGTAMVFAGTMLFAELTPAFGSSNTRKPAKTKKLN